MCGLSCWSSPGLVSEGNIYGDYVTLGHEGVEVFFPLNAVLVKAIGLLVPIIVDALHIPRLRHSSSPLEGHNHQLLPDVKCFQVSAN